MTRKPQRRSQRRNNSGPAAAARRRAATDPGLTGDKVPGFDPAAAPLGTDAETGGAPPLAADDPPLPEGARADPAGLAADPSGTDRGSSRMRARRFWPVIAAMLVAIAIVVAIIFVM